MSLLQRDAVCVPCDNIPPCPPCTKHQQCQQLYPNDCHICPSNVCADRPDNDTHPKGIVGGVISALMGALVVGIASYVIWKVFSIGRQRRFKRSSTQEKASVASISAPMPITQVVLHDTMQGPPAHFYSPPSTPAVPALCDPFETPMAPPANALERISEGTETSAHVRTTPSDMDAALFGERSCPDVPQDELPLRRVLVASPVDARAPTQSRAMRIPLSIACPRLIQSPKQK